MTRSKSLAEGSPPGSEPRSVRKRPVDAMDLDGDATRTKRRRGSTRETTNAQSSSTDDSETEGHEEENQAAAKDMHPPSTDAVETPQPTPRRRGRPPKSQSQASTPSKTPAKSIFATPVKHHETESATPKRQAADRSARKKSARALIENVLGDGDDDEQEDDDDVLVREIYEDSDAEDLADRAGAATDGLNGAAPGSATPSKARKPRPRPNRAKSPTPPRDLPPHELYFAHNKPGRPRTSDNTLGSLSLLTHDEYFGVLHHHRDPHADDVEHLENLHAESFPQWAFELSQGYSICLYGFGSKRALLQKLAQHLHASPRGKPARRTVVVNGYAHAAATREVLACIASAVDPSHKTPTSTPAATVQIVCSQLSNTNLTLTLIINSIDAPPLRKPGTQDMLARLAAHPQINLVCSADTPDFPLLWDIGVRSAFNFVFHDCTTFAPFTVELDVIDEVHELLGRRARRVNGREGVAFVLKSLPENAKNLFQLLVGEVLIAMEEDEGNAVDEAAGVEYRMVYNKAVEEFICSSEMAFRTLLKEFHDHQMITSRKDALGTELLSLHGPGHEAYE
ncbi:Origin recognition complex, subunit 2 [Metarhizium album ARSEF 1941]|uniref:Origin recognition complex subunit 2 n=1 Tax=Metarhizium album (strain ARSEF 1941) TaxID=1081103 RepID=A0A0B2WYR3_METAS|nr:Origin recognition complex, subunit 2 [Metarhizium album ARSEF 1941]KHO01417.1 Origin recognition complex, subunit 2 [Metarhizium album ARSEF 1941]